MNHKESLLKGKDTTKVKADKVLCSIRLFENIVQFGNMIKLTTKQGHYGQDRLMGVSQDTDGEYWLEMLRHCICVKEVVNVEVVDHETF